MKRILLILLGVLLLNSYALAQGRDFTQTGKATNELNDEGFVAAHPSRPLNTKVTVVNTTTGKEVEVTIVRRISGSTNRIIDLSPAVWNELGLNENTQVRLHLNPPAQAVAAAPEPAAEPAPPPAPLPPPETPAAPEPAPTPVVTEAPPPVTPPSQPVEPVIDTRRITINIVSAPAARELTIRVIPGMPDPARNAVYRLQLGSFSSMVFAQQYFDWLTETGFTPVHEKYGNLHRVVLPKVKNTDVRQVIERLDAAGFSEVWVRPEK